MSKHVTEDLTGHKFGLFTVLERATHPSFPNHTYWLCRCQCGRESIKQHYVVKKGLIKSCRLCRGPNYRGKQKEITPESHPWDEIMRRVEKVKAERDCTPGDHSQRLRYNKRKR